MTEEKYANRGTILMIGGDRKTTRDHLKIFATWQPQESQEIFQIT